MSGRRAHRAATLMFSAMMIVIGVALIVQWLGGAGSGLSARLVLGVLFTAAGVGRTYVELRRGRRA